VNFEKRLNMRIKKEIDSFFVLSKSERNGAIVLFAIVMLLIIFRFLIPVLIPNDKRFEIDYDQRLSQLEKIKDSLKIKSYNPGNQTTFGNPDKVVKIYKNVENDVNLKNIPTTKFRFDPNLVSLEEMIKLGFPVYAARNLIKYRGKGGVFHKVEDLKRIYGVDSELYTNIQPYIIIHEEKVNKKILVEINEADSATLTSLKGIGPVYAARICKYRNYLGGFVSLEQLKEVYQFPEETFLAIKDYLTLDEKKVEKININFTDVNELKGHPYCSYKEARKIIDYRSKKGYIQSVDQLLQDSIVELSVFNRFAPYLKVK
jgi:DNA uptake protein ComE-like DNA-binding protein